MLVSAIHQHEPAIGIHMSIPPSHVPPHPTCVGCHGALDLGSLCHRANSHWSSLLHMVIETFQCYAVNSSHLPLSPLHPQACSLCLCLHWCPANRFISAIFLDSYICINIWYLFFPFWLTLLCIIGSRFIHFTRTDSTALLFIDEQHSPACM